MESYDFNSGSNDHHSRDLKEERTWKKKDFYEGEYMPQMHKIGKLTGLLGAVLSFLPALVLAVVYGLLPKPAALATAFISAASAFGFLWVVEPISYFTVLGP